LLFSLKGLALRRAEHAASVFLLYFAILSQMLKNAEMEMWRRRGQNRQGHHIGNWSQAGDKH
jgi:hypothetical protein